MEEIWKDIPGYEGEYQVSNIGNVRSCDRWIYPNGKCQWLKKGKMMFKFQAPDGYVRTALSRNGKTIHFPIHRLVAMAFIPNPLNLPFINHKDECKHNNVVENLEWCTAKYNCNYGTKSQRASISLKKAKVGIPIIQLSLNGDIIKEYQNAEIAAEENGFYRTNISACCRGKVISAHGYKWRYKDDLLYQEAKKKLSDRLMKQKREKLDRYAKSSLNVVLLNLSGDYIKTYESARIAHEELRVSVSHITACCRGERHSSGGYKFVYERDYLKEIKQKPMAKELPVQLSLF